MGNISDYLDWRGDLTFEQAPFNEVDNYILCKLGSPDLTGIVPVNGEVELADALNAYFAKHNRTVRRRGIHTSLRIIPMMRRLPNVKRFATLPVSDFVNRIDPEKDEQFSALTIGLPGDTRFIAFRGTDDTLVAWKEDFLISVEEAVEAQKDAADYLVREARKPGKLIVGGHSKGGNLAVYSALMAPDDVKARISDIFNNDGPGFRTDVSTMPEYRSIKPKLHTIVSQHTTVGKLLYHESDCTIVKSEHSGITAHDGLQWEVLGTRFIRCEDYAIGSKAFEAAVKELEAQMDFDERKQFIDELFGLLASTGAVTLNDLNEHRLRQAAELAQGMKQSPRVRKFTQTLLSLMVRETVASAKQSISIPELHLRRKD